MFGLLPFTRAEALRAGLTKRQWEHAVASGELLKMRQGVYANPLTTDDRLRYAQQVAGALKGKQRHLACGGSAAALLGLPNPYLTWWTRVPISIAGPRSRPDVGVRCDPGWEGVETAWGPCTDLVDTATVIAADLPLPQALMVTDAAARQLAGTDDRFELAGEECRRRVRAHLTRRAAHPALMLANPAAESPAESFYRGHMLEHGFPEPACGVPLQGVSGRQYFIDLLLGGLAIEVDGEEKYDGREALVAEKRREDDLRGIGLRFLRPWARDVFADPAGEMTRLRVIHRVVPTWV